MRDPVRVRRVLVVLASVVLVVTYLPGVYGPPRGLSGFRPATLVIFPIVALIVIAAEISSRFAPSYKFDRAVLVGWIGVAAGLTVVLAGAYFVLETAITVREATGPTVTGYYCRTDLFPTHRATCLAHDRWLADGLRDLGRVVLFGFIAIGPVREASARPTKVGTV